MTYADETFYKENYLLGRKPVISTGFEFYARSASRIIDQYTFDRLKSGDAVPEAVPMCCCDLAEAMYCTENQQKAAGGKTSEKVGTYSVSFASAQEIKGESAKDQRNIVMKWLSNTGLCYKGVD